MYNLLKKNEHKVSDPRLFFLGSMSAYTGERNDVHDIRSGMKLLAFTLAASRHLCELRTVSNMSVFYSNAVVGKMFERCVKWDVP